MLNSLKEILFTTLIISTFRDQYSRHILQEELNLSTLKEYLDEQIYLAEEQEPNERSQLTLSGN